MAELIAAAISNGSSQQLTAAVQKFASDINKPTAFEAYPLHFAVWRNSLSAVQQLLDAGAKTDVVDGESGWSPLHKALYQGSLAAAALLLQHGSSLSLTDTQGRLPLDLVSHDLKQHLLTAASTAAGAAAGASRDVVAYNNLYSWGNGANFTLGTGSTDLHLTPTRVEINHQDSAAVTPGSSGGAANPAAAASAPVGRVVCLAAAKFHSAYVTEDGRLYTFGFGRGGRLGHGDFHIHSGSSAQIFPRAVSGLGKRSVVAVAAAKHHTLVATSAGEVFSFGSNNHGRLGYAAVDSQPTPKKISALPPRARIIAVAAANKHSAAVTSGGEVFTWGANSSGQLGYGTPDSGFNATPRLVDSLKGKMLVQVAAAKRHTVVLTADGEVYTFGHKVVTPKKVLLAGSRDTYRAAPATTAAPAAATSTSASSSSSLVACSSTTTPSTSSSASATADPASLTPAGTSAVPVGTEQLVFHHGISDIARPFAVAVAAGAAHTSVLTRTGVILVWPSAAPNPRPLEVSGPLAGRKVVCISAGKNRTAVVTDEGYVYMWESRDGKTKAKKKVVGDGQQQPWEKGEKGLSSVPGGKQEGGTAKRIGSLTAAAAAADGDTDKQQQQAIAGDRLPSVERSSSSVGNPAADLPLASPTGASSSTKTAAGTSSIPPTPTSSSSSVAYGSTSSSSGDVALKAMLKAWVGPTAPVVPIRVLGPRHVTAVAVGEKHSLAVQTWVAPVLPDHGQDHDHMLLFGSKVEGSRKNQQQQQEEQQGSAAADDGAGSDSSDLQDEQGYSAAAKASSSHSTQIGGSSSSSWHWDPHSHARHHDPVLEYDICSSSNRISSGQGIGPESLSVICERAVAQQLVEPRTAPAILEYADMAGAHLLKAYCLSVAVRNLDMLISEARTVFESLPQHLLITIEKLYRQLTFGDPSDRIPRRPWQDSGQQDCVRPDLGGLQQQQEAAAALRRPADDLGFHFLIAGGEILDEPQQDGQQQHQQQEAAAAAMRGPPTPLQHIYKRLCLGKRPTNYPDSLHSLYPSTYAAAGSSLSGHALLAAAAAKGAAGGCSWFEIDDHNRSAVAAAALPLVPTSAVGSSSSSFINSDAGRLAALREAAQKLHRNLLKKLQQIETLEARQSEGIFLDPQQMAKVSLKGSILDAIGQLRAGTGSLEDVQGLLARAQAVAQKLYLSPAGGQDNNGGGTPVGSYGAGASSLLGSSPAAAAAAVRLAAAAADVQSQTAVEAGSSSDHAAAASPASAKKGSRKMQQGHKGDLSAFLAGALERKARDAATAAAAAPVAQDVAAAAAGSNSSGAGPKGLAWGGAAMQAANVPSLREMLQGDVGTPAAAAAADAVSGTSAVSKSPATQQQQVAKISAKAANVSPAPNHSSGTTGSSSSKLAVGAGSSTVPQLKQQPAAAGTSVPLTSVSSKRAGSMVGATGSSSSTPVVGAPSSGDRSSSSTVRGVVSALPPVAPSQQHSPLTAAVGHHHVGLAPTSSTPTTVAAAAGGGGGLPGSSSETLGSGIKLSLMDFVTHKRASPLTVGNTKSKTSVVAAAVPVVGSPAAAAAAGPAWGGLTGSSPPVSGAVSLRHIQQEQEQVKATTGWAAYQREKAAAAAGSSAATAATAGNVGDTPAVAAAAAAPSAVIQHIRAAGGLTKALQAAAGGSSAVPGSSPTAASLGRSYKGGSSSSSFLVPGSSPPAPSKWYIRDQPQVRSLADIQSEEQLLQEQMELLQQIEAERALAEQQQRQQQRKDRRRSRNKMGERDAAADGGGGGGSSGMCRDRQRGSCDTDGHHAAGATDDEQQPFIHHRRQQQQQQPDERGPPGCRQRHGGVPADGQSTRVQGAGEDAPAGGQGSSTQPRQRHRRRQRTAAADGSSNAGVSEPSQQVQQQQHQQHRSDVAHQAGPGEQPQDNSGSSARRGGGRSVRGRGPRGGRYGGRASGATVDGGLTHDSSSAAGAAVQSASADSSSAADAAAVQAASAEHSSVVVCAAGRGRGFVGLGQGKGGRGLAADRQQWQPKLHALQNRPEPHVGS